MTDKKKLTEFSNWILKIGSGTIEGIKDDENDDTTWIEIPKKYIVNYDSDPIKKISNPIYDNFLDNFDNIEYLKPQAIVAPKIKQLMILINIYYL